MYIPTDQVPLYRPGTSQSTLVSLDVPAARWRQRRDYVTMGINSFGYIPTGQVPLYRPDTSYSQILPYMGTIIIPTLVDSDNVEPVDTL